MKLYIIPQLTGFHLLSCYQALLVPYSNLGVTIVVKTLMHCCLPVLLCLNYNQGNENKDFAEFWGLELFIYLIVNQ